MIPPETDTLLAAEEFAEYIEPSPPPTATICETALTLSAAAVLSFEAENAHEIIPMHSPVKEIANSMAHPSVGYLGALAAYAMLRCDFLRRRPLLQALAGGTFADVVVERSQDILMGGLANTDWFLAPAHQLESLKDYAFALGGAMVFYAQRKFSSRRKITQAALASAADASMQTSQQV